MKLKILKILLAMICMGSQIFAVTQEVDFENGFRADQFSTLTPKIYLVSESKHREGYGLKNQLIEMAIQKRIYFAEESRARDEEYELGYLNMRYNYEEAGYFHGLEDSFANLFHRYIIAYGFLLLPVDEMDENSEFYLFNAKLAHLVELYFYKYAEKLWDEFCKNTKSMDNDTKFLVNKINVFRKKNREIISSKVQSFANTAATDDQWAAFFKSYILFLMHARGDIKEGEPVLDEEVIKNYLNDPKKNYGKVRKQVLVGMRDFYFVENIKAIWDEAKDKNVPLVVIIGDHHMKGVMEGLTVAGYEYHALTY